MDGQQTVDEWLHDIGHFATLIADQSEKYQTESDTLEKATVYAQSLTEILIEHTRLLSDCDAIEFLLSLEPELADINPERAEAIQPLMNISNNLSSITGFTGRKIWAQESNKLENFLDKIPLPEKERRVVENLKWTKKMFEKSTKAIKGVSKEIKKQDGSGIKQAKEAAKEIEDTAAKPPVKPSLIQRFANAVSNFFRTLLD